MNAETGPNGKSSESSIMGAEGSAVTAAAAPAVTTEGDKENTAPSPRRPRTRMNLGMNLGMGSTREEGGRPRA